jgi:hypothetical protein
MKNMYEEKGTILYQISAFNLLISYVVMTRDNYNVKSMV